MSTFDQVPVLVGVSVGSMRVLSGRVGRYDGVAAVAGELVQVVEDEGVALIY